MTASAVHTHPSKGAAGLSFSFASAKVSRFDDGERCLGCKYASKNVVVLCPSKHETQACQDGEYH